MNDIRLLINIAKTINPTVGLVADLAITILGSIPVENKTLQWLEKRSIKLLERLIEENKKEQPSKVLIHEIEVRLHETLDIIMDLNKERPWDG